MVSKILSDVIDFNHLVGCFFGCMLEGVELVLGNLPPHLMSLPFRIVLVYLHSSSYQLS